MVALHVVVRCPDSEWRVGDMPTVEWVWHHEERLLGVAHTSLLSILEGARSVERTLIFKKALDLFDNGGILLRAEQQPLQAQMASCQLALQLDPLTGTGSAT